MDQGAEKWRDVLFETKERKVKYEKEHPATAPPQDVGNNEEETLNRIPQNFPDDDGPLSGTQDEDNNVPGEFDSNYVVGNDLGWPEEETYDDEPPERDNYRGYVDESLDDFGRNPAENQNVGEVYSDPNTNSNGKDDTKET